MDLSHNINKIRQIIAQTEFINHREPDSVLLLAASKEQSIHAITEAFRLGIDNFAENYFQEAQQKINRLKELPIHWHFIGPIQSNKTKGIAANFSWVHSINRYKVAALLNEHRPSDLAPLNVCLQISLIQEETKSGITIEDAAKLALQVEQLPFLKLRGLMCIPPPQKNETEQYELFLKLNKLMHNLNKQLGLTMDSLSMGMSDDLVPAIQAGSTMVRVGRAIFGERKGVNNEH